MNKILGIMGVCTVISVFLVGLAYAGSVVQPKMKGSQWAVYEQTTLPNGKFKLYPATHATTTPTGIEFQMPDATSTSPTYVNYLLDKYTASLTESNTISAAMSLGATPGIAFVGNPDGGNSLHSTVRLFMQSNLPVSGGSACAGGGYNEYNYWWSNPTSYSLGGTGSSGPITLPITLSVTLNPADWSDLCGHFGNKNATTEAAFAAAIANVKDVGLSFGSGSSFANGAGIDGNTGSATFELQSYTIT